MSKRQNTLFGRLKSAKERYVKTKQTLDHLLLSKLHSKGVYTTDQLDKVYVTRVQANKVYKQLKNKKKNNVDNPYSNSHKAKINDSNKLQSKDNQQDSSHSSQNNDPSLLDSDKQ